MKYYNVLALTLVVVTLSGSLTLRSLGSLQGFVTITSNGIILLDDKTKYEPEDGKCYVGAWLGENSISPDEIRRDVPWWIQQTGKGLVWYAIMQNFGPTETTEPLWMIDDYKPLIDEGLFDGVALTWQPAYNWDLQGTGEACIADIVSGKYDNHIRTEARRCKTAGYPIIIRFGHEMNGYWMGWGNSPEQFKQAWIKVVTLFREEGVTNVAWYWCPNYDDNPPDRKFQNYYPGDEFVDYVGIDVYANNDWGQWADPEKQLGNPYGNVYDTYSSKPYIIGEWGCSSDLTEQQNAEYVSKFFDAVETRTRIKMIIHWHGDGWKLSLYPQALEVYRNRISDSRYLAEIQ